VTYAPGDIGTDLTIGDGEKEQKGEECGESEGRKVSRATDTDKRTIADSEVGTKPERIAMDSLNELLHLSAEMSEDKRESGNRRPPAHNSLPL
jgi:hypothetical protein